MGRDYFSLRLHTSWRLSTSGLSKAGSRDALGKTCHGQSSLGLSVCSCSLAPRVIFGGGEECVLFLMATEHAPCLTFARLLT